MRRWRRSLAVGSLVSLMATLWLATHLPVRASMSYLLPEQTPSVRHLRALEQRANVLGTLMVGIFQSDAQARQGAAAAMAEGLRSLGPERVAHLTLDRAAQRQFAWNHRFLLASTDDLQRAAEALRPWLARASRRKNLLALDFEDAPAAEADSTGATTAAADELLARLHALEADSRDPGPLVSQDGSVQLLVLQTPFAAGSTKQSAALLEAARALASRVEADFPGTEVGLAGDVVSSVEEERSILQGMLLSTAATMGLVALGLLLYTRSAFGTLAITYALVVGTAATFAVTERTVGHLNIVTAFLASIVLGNGINFGIMLLGRWFEVWQNGGDVDEAVAAAIEGSWRGTLAAALAAAAAYASLTVTTFRGFYEFGWIASAGMVLNWLAAYAVVPPLLSWGAERGLLSPKAQPPLGAWLLACVPRAGGRSLALVVLWAAVTAGATLLYLGRQPFEDDFRNIRSDSAALQREQAVMRRIDRAFGSGISGGFVLAVERREEARPLLARLRAQDLARPEGQRLFGRLQGLDDALPDDVDARRRWLLDIRGQLLGPDAQRLPASLRRRLAPLVPPAELPTWGDADVPTALAWPFTEADGTRGRLLLAAPAPERPMWSARHLLAFVDEIRALDLGPGVAIGGSAFVFADMVRLVTADGPRASVAATVAACVTVVGLLGFGVHAGVTLFAGALGVLSMLAGCSALGLKVNFLDFVALPITIGIGIDYAVNLAARSRAEGAGQARRALAGAGGAICMASYTTIVGYGSMLASANRGIRSFGHAAILGEFTCLAAALWAAPLVLDWAFRAPADNKPGAGRPAP